MHLNYVSYTEGSLLNLIDLNYRIAEIFVFKQTQINISASQVILKDKIYTFSYATPYSAHYINVNNPSIPFFCALSRGA